MAFTPDFAVTDTSAAHADKGAEESEQSSHATLSSRYILSGIRELRFQPLASQAVAMCRDTMTDQELRPLSNSAQIRRALGCLRRVLIAGWVWIQISLDGSTKSRAVQELSHWPPDCSGDVLESNY